MNSNRVVTNKASNALKELIMEDPTNIAAACRFVGKKYKIKTSTLQAHYNLKLKTKHTLFTMNTKNGLVINSKVNQVKSMTNQKLTLKNGMQNLGTLSKDQKADILDIILGI